jgi:hypothetical protein
VGTQQQQQQSQQQQGHLFELSAEDYAHRCLDMVSTLLLSMYTSAYEQGVLPALPRPVQMARDFREVDSYQLLRYVLDWPLPYPSRDTFLRFLYGAQTAITNADLFCTSILCHLESLGERRSNLVQRLATQQSVRHEDLTICLELLLSLTIMLANEQVRLRPFSHRTCGWVGSVLSCILLLAELSQMRDRAQRLKVQYEIHTRSRKSRLTVSHTLERGRESVSSGGP